MVSSDHTNWWYNSFFFKHAEIGVLSLPLNMSTSEEGNSAQPDAPAPAGDGAASGGGLVRTQSMRRLRYEGGPGEEGYVRRMKVLEACMAFKSILFKKRSSSDGKEKTKTQVYDDVAADLNQYHKELFGGLLKGPGVQDQWSKAIAAAQQQQADKQQNKHMWYNGNVLRDMSDYERMLDRLFTEKQAVQAAETKKQEEEAAEERDARDRLSGAFERVGARYSQGEQFATGKRAAREPSQSPDKSEESEASSGASYRSGTKKGNTHAAKGNAGLSPDKPKTELESLLDMQAQLIQKAEDMAERGDKGKKEEQRESAAAVMAAQAALMAQVVAFKNAGLEVPANIMAKLSSM